MKLSQIQVDDRVICHGMRKGISSAQLTQIALVVMVGVCMLQHAKHRLDLEQALASCSCHAAPVITRQAPADITVPQGPQPTTSHVCPPSVPLQFSRVSRVLKPESSRKFCSPTRFIPTFTICHHDPAKDIWISEEIQRAGLWDHQGNFFVRQLLEQYPHAWFLDVGANIGVFSLMALSINRTVFAMNRRLGTSSALFSLR